MTGDQTAELVYLSVIGLVLAFWLFARTRLRLGQTMQYLAVWGLIFLGAIAVVGLWDDIRGTVVPRQAMFDTDGRIELPRARDGHYYATLDVNGVPTRFVVDTGASVVVLTQEDAQRAGIEPKDLVFLSEAMTANGVVRTAPVRLDSLAIGPFEDRNLRAFVNGGDMNESLLGMSYLQRFDRLEISGGRLVLER